MRNRKLAVAVSVAALTVGLSFSAAPAQADSIPIGSKRCGFWQDTSYFENVFVTNCLKSQGAVVKVDRGLWPDPTYCVPAGTTKHLGYRGGSGPSSVDGVDYLGPVSHC